MLQVPIALLKNMSWVQHFKVTDHHFKVSLLLRTVPILTITIPCPFVCFQMPGIILIYNDFFKAGCKILR